MSTDVIIICSVRTINMLLVPVAWRIACHLLCFSQFWI